MSNTVTIAVVESLRVQCVQTCGMHMGLLVGLWPQVCA